MASKTLILVSPDGKATREVDSPVQETQLKFNGWTVHEDSAVQTLAAKKGPAEKTPVTAFDTPTASEPSEAEQSGSSTPAKSAAKPKASN